MGDRAGLLAGALGAALRRLPRTGLRGIWLRGRLPAGPVVWAATHQSWWDPFVGAALAHRLGRRPALLMRQDNLERYRFVRPLGVFGTAEPRRGLALLRAGRVLLVFPEGELGVPGPPGPLADGAAWYARQAPARLCAAAVRVVLRGQQRPEAYVSLVEVDTDGTRARVGARLAGTLARELADLDSRCAVGDPRAPLPGFRLAVAGRESWDARVDALTGWRPWRR
jgi:1-acyl-sn-glycerol-3-phosphate acyltransferase